MVLDFYVGVQKINWYGVAVHKRTYPEDEFDRLAQERVAVGAHRKANVKNKKWVALLAIVLITPALAWAFVYLGGAETVQKNVHAAPSVAAPTSATPENTPTQASPDTGDEKDEKDAKAEVTPEASADLTTEVRVLNGTSTTGLAAGKQDTLKAQGFSNVTADNYNGGSSPTVSTVYYANDSDKVTAEKVASVLGISDIVQNASAVAGGKGIVVVLRS